jgi:hypothetical protein
LLSALRSSPTSTSASASRVVDTSRSSTPSVRPSPRVLLPSTPRTRTPPRPLSSRRPSSPTTVPSSLPTPVAPSPRSSVVVVPALVARSRTVKYLSRSVYSFYALFAKVAAKCWEWTGVYRSIGVCIS